MKKKITSILGLALCLVMLISIMPVAQFAQAQEYTLEVLNPKANVERIQMTPLAERLDSFENKKIITYALSLPANLQAVREIMAERFGGPSGNNPLNVTFTNINDKSGVGLTDNYTAYESGARAADAVIVGTAF